MAAEKACCYFLGQSLAKAVLGRPAGDATCHDLICPIRWGWECFDRAPRQAGEDIRFGVWQIDLYNRMAK
jgi:hypothetical protein